MKSMTFRHGLMALLGTALALVLISFFRQRCKNGSPRFAELKTRARDVVQGVAEGWAD